MIFESISHNVQYLWHISINWEVTKIISLETPKVQFLLDRVKSLLPTVVFLLISTLWSKVQYSNHAVFPGVYSVYQQYFFKLLAKKHIGAPLIIIFLVNRKNGVHVVFTSCGIKLWFEWVCCFPLRIHPFNTFTEIYCKSEIAFLLSSQPFMHAVGLFVWPCVICLLRKHSCREKNNYV